MKAVCSCNGHRACRERNFDLLKVAGALSSFLRDKSDDRILREAGLGLVIVTEIISVSHYFYGRASYKLKNCIMMIIIKTD